MEETWERVSRKDEVKKQNVMKSLKIFTWRERVVIDNETRKRAKNHKRKNLMVPLLHGDFGSIFILK